MSQSYVRGVPYERLKMLRELLALICSNIQAACRQLLCRAQDSANLQAHLHLITAFTQVHCCIVLCPF